MLKSYLVNKIKEVNSNNSSNYKKEFLKNMLLENNDYVLNKFIEFVYDKNVNFYFTYEQIEKHIKDFTYEENYGLMDIMNLLKKLNNVELKRKEVFEIISKLDEESLFLIKRCLDKSLFDSVSIKLLNKIWNEAYGKNLFNDYPYMRCSLMNDVKHITYPAISQVKADGLFCNILIDVENNDIRFFTRQNKEIKFLYGNKLKKHKDNIINTIKKLFPENNAIVLMGEILVKNKDGTIKQRQEGNGLINSIISLEKTLFNLSLKKQTDKVIKEIEDRKRIATETEDSIIFSIWDCIPRDILFEENYTKIFSYEERLNQVFNIVSELQINNIDLFNIIECKIVNSLDEAKEHFNNCISRGLEGTILKNMNMLYKNGTSKDQIKFKIVAECELRVIGFEYGSGKYKDGIGSLICKSDDGKVEVNVSGLTEEMRGLERVDKNDASKGLKVIDGFDFNQYNNKIITIEFNDIIKSTNKDTYSLFLPRIKEIRIDKDITDTLENILSMLNK